MSEVTIGNWKTGELLSDIPVPSLEWLCENFYLPYITERIEESKKKPSK